MNELSLFSGAGGGLLVSKHFLNWRTIGYVEIEKYCQEIIKARIKGGLLDDAPIWSDISTFDGKQFRGLVDVVTAGFPCQPFSVAGRRKGADDERNLWPETIRIIRETKIRFVFLENVPGLTVYEKLILFDTVEEGRVYTPEEWEQLCEIYSIRYVLPSYFGRILGDLAEDGYDAKWCVLGADDAGAPHRRKRIWILAHSTGGRREMEGHGSKCNYETKTEKTTKSTWPNNITWWDQDPADLPNTPIGSGRESESRSVVRTVSRRGGKSHRSKRPIKSRMGRVAYGVAHRVDRLKALGNGQVPAVAREAWERLISDI